MDPVDENAELSDLKVSKDAIIETVAEEVLSQQKPVAVLDDDGRTIGLLNCSTILHILFGDRSGEKTD